MTYPYIGKSPQGNSYLVVNKKLIYSFISKSWLFETEGFADLENITADYLRNTYGKVESKEHAEFIVELARASNISVASDWVEGTLFCFAYNCEGNPFLSFHPELLAKSDNEKLITLPLPPKESEEWPQVGDEVAWGCLTNKCTVIALHDCHAWIKDKDGELETININQLMKPPTPEEELAEKLHEFFITSNEHLAKAIINGKIKGLSYKPE